MTPSDRVLERAVTTISEQAAKASDLIDEAMDTGLPADHPVTIAAKMLRLELLKTMAELERGLEEFSLTCTDCGRDVHWVSSLWVAGHWSHAEPAPHDAPAVCSRGGQWLDVRTRHRRHTSMRGRWLQGRPEERGDRGLIGQKVALDEVLHRFLLLLHLFLRVEQAQHVVCERSLPR
jgi:hypothetical protein